MQLLEFQGKALLREAGIVTPEGVVVKTGTEAAQAADRLGGSVVIKAQVQSGRRGKSGAIRFASDPGEAEREAGQLLQSAVQDLAVTSVLVETRADIAAELYLAVVNDPKGKGPLIMYSDSGGMEIEELHARSPESVLLLPVDIARGLDASAVQAFVERSSLPPQQRKDLAELLGTVYELYRKLDADLVEINPLVLTSSGGLTALDCKLSLDPSGLARHPELVERFQSDLPVTATALESEARKHGLLFMELDGDVGILANGAGLTMATLDAVTHYGGRPANFLEIGGDAYTKALPALQLVLANRNVKSLLVNFCGAFARTDVMTEGVVNALTSLATEIPVSFSIHGTGAQEAIQLVKSQLGLEPHELMDDAVREAVRHAAEARESR